MITLPESIQELVGRKINRIFTSHPANDQIVFDLETSSVQRRTRFAYELNGQLSRIQNLSNMVGYTVSEVRALDNEPDGTSKMAIFTDDGARFGVIYFTGGGSGWVPIDDTDVDYGFLSSNTSIVDSVVSYDGASSGDFRISLASGEEVPIRATSESWSAHLEAAAAEFEWADGEETQPNEAVDPSIEFSPSPLEMTLAVGQPIKFDFDSEGAASFDFLIEAYVNTDVELTDVNLGRNPPFNSSTQYVVQEDDVRFALAGDDSGGGGETPVDCGWVPIEEAFTVNFEQGASVVSNGPTMTNSIVSGVNVINDGRAEECFRFSCEDVTTLTYVRATIQSYSANIPAPGAQVFPSSLSIELGDDENFVDIENEIEPDVNGDVSGFTPSVLIGTMNAPVGEGIAGVSSVSISSAQEDPPGHVENTESYEILFEVYMCNGVPGVPPE